MNKRDMLSCLHELDELISSFESAVQANDEEAAYEALDKIGHCCNANLTELDEARKRTICGNKNR